MMTSKHSCERAQRTDVCFDYCAPKQWTDTANKKHRVIKNGSMQEM